MKNIWILAKKELTTFFDSFTAYILMLIFLGFSGFFTWLYGNGDVFFTNQASIRPFFGICYWTLFFFIPALTMKMFAEEKKTGTLEFLLSKPITNRELVLGKFLACLLLVAITLLFSLPYYFAVAWLGPVDHGSVICGYIGLMLLASAYTGIGLFCSSVTNNQIVAFLLALVIGIFFHLLFGLLAGSLSGIVAQVFYSLDVFRHFDSVSRGVLDTKDIIYFVSVTLLGLFGCEYILAKRNVND